MTYFKDGTEYLTWDERRVWLAVGALTTAGRAGNNSQIASTTCLSRSKVTTITATLRARGFIKDVSKRGTAAYHWRHTSKRAPALEPRPLTAVVSIADVMRPGESLSADDWVGREPGESLADFRARRDGMTPRETARLEIDEGSLSEALADLDVIRAPGQPPMSYQELAKALLERARFATARDHTEEEPRS